MCKSNAPRATNSWLKFVAVLMVIAIAMVGTWIAARATAPSAGESTAASAPEGVQGTRGDREAAATSDSLSKSVLERLRDAANEPDEVVIDQARSQLTYIRLSDGMHLGTSNEKFARPALSLSKLYIADYVLDEGNNEEKYEALRMISTSDDDVAEGLFAEYPESIDEVADKYGLYATESGNYWGNSLTSTYDVVKFVAALKDEDSTHPILVAMSQPDEIAADGYEQDFGTAVMSNVIGTKWGWSNNRQVHSSVSFGENFIVAASVNGSARDLTRLVRNQVSGTKLKEATTWFLDSREAAETSAVPTETVITD